MQPCLFRMSIRQKAKLLAQKEKMLQELLNVPPQRGHITHSPEIQSKINKLSEEIEELRSQLNYAVELNSISA